MTDIRETLRKARAHIIHDRDCLYEGISLHDGTVPDPGDAEELARVDALIDEINQALSNGRSDF